MARTVKSDDMDVESGFFGRVVQLGVRGDASAADILDWVILDVETDAVTRLAGLTAYLRTWQRNRIDGTVDRVYVKSERSRTPCCGLYQRSRRSGHTVRHEPMVSSPSPQLSGTSLPISDPVSSRIFLFRIFRGVVYPERGQ